MEKIQDQLITVIGPELNEVSKRQVAFGKIVLIGGHGFNEDNACERCQEMEQIRFKLNLDGYMLRAMPQENKEWSRISRQAMQSGFSLQVLGNELIREFKRLDYVDAVEMIFITAHAGDIQKLRPMGDKVARITQAMNKIFDDLAFDCVHCSFADVCNEIDGLKAMHKKQ